MTKTSGTSKARKISDVFGYYKTLGVSPSATQDDIRIAARELLKETHPDMGGDQEDFIAALKAYDVLSSPELRAEYDAKTTSVNVVSVSTTKHFEMPETTSDSPAWYKEPQDVLSQHDIGLVMEWHNLLLEAAYKFGAALEIKAGVSKSLAGYELVDGIAVIGSEEEPQRGAAYSFILKGMIENGIKV